MTRSQIAFAMGMHALCLGFGLPQSTARADGIADAAALERFETSVRPVLANKCWRCHGPDQSKGGLRLDSAAAIAQGGDAGPVIDPDQPEESSLLVAIRYQGDLKMPPKGKLSELEIAGLTQWVKDGAKWPETKPSDAPQPASNSPNAKPASANTPAPNSLEAGRSFWAFQPVRDPKPPELKTPGWAKSPIDRFILSALEAKGFTPAPPADKRALIRRATYDLTGLPPTPEAIDEFLGDPSPEAFAAVVNRLLDSPRYGERWGRHWLDLARYADSNGMDENVAYSNAYRYRDYVVDAFNDDKPYDQFVQEQIAGDLLPKSTIEGLNNERITATGFLVIGPKMLAEDDPVKMEMDIIDEQVDTVGRVFMGLTMGCARCHDHKFDPIPTADYYSLAGFFKSTKSMANHQVVAMWNEAPIKTQEYLDAAAKHEALVAEKTSAFRTVQKQAAEEWLRAENQPPSTRIPGVTINDLYPRETADKLGPLLEELESLKASAPTPPSVMSVADQAPTDLRIHIRGNHLTLGNAVPRRFLQVIDGEAVPKIPGGQSGRLELARWLTDKSHPLTSRVMVNRIWLGHFGNALVRTPDNFGRLGDAPVHADLLDWLASRFIESGWSIKSLHRAIMLSSTYQMSTQDNPELAIADPENRLHWKMPRRRLEAEAIRDALLAVSGELDDTMNGTFLKTANHAYVNNTGGQGDVDYTIQRRSIYLPIIRSGLYDVFQAFDFADPSTSNGLRVPTTVAPQALFMMNDPLVLRTSAALAKNLLDDVALDDPGRVATVYLKAFGRPVTDRESERALQTLRALEKRLETEGVGLKDRPVKAWQGLCQAILGSSEFLFVD